MPVQFDLAIVNASEDEGEFRIYVVKAGSKFKSEEISHIKFEARPEPKPLQIETVLRRPNNPAR